RRLAGRAARLRPRRRHRLRARRRRRHDRRDPARRLLLGRALPQRPRPVRPPLGPGPPHRGPIAGAEQGTGRGGPPPPSVVGGTMKGSLVVAILLAAPAARADDGWAAWQPLLGTFVADGATMTLEPSLDGKVLVRKGRSGKHEDLMVIYAEGGKTRADYWDNEGHVIRYDVTLAANQPVFLAGPRPDAPGFRLPARFADRDNLGMSFEMAPPGGAFKQYLSGKMRRKR